VVRTAIARMVEIRNTPAKIRMVTLSAWKANAVLP
jgi:hypothetical protein